MIKRRRDMVIKEYAKILREGGEYYSDFMVNLSDNLDGMADVFAIQGTALRYIYENLGHEFEFPKLEAEDRRYGMIVHCYPKDGDDTKWTIRLEVEFESNEEVKDD